MDNFDYEKIKREKESNYLRLIIIGALVVIVFLGNIDIPSGVAPEGKTPITSLAIPNKDNLTNKFKNDIINYIPNAKKTNIRKIHKDNKVLAEEVGTTKIKVEELSQEEEQLRLLISNVPIEIYNHNKLDLTAFMVEEMKERNLIYSIKYNYDFLETTEEGEEGDVEEQKETEEEVEEEVVVSKVTPITGAFSVRIYQIDKEDNYAKVLDLLDTIYIKEPYEILKFKMGYDNISRSYYIDYVIGI